MVMRQLAIQVWEPEVARIHVKLSMRECMSVITVILCKMRCRDQGSPEAWRPASLLMAAVNTMKGLSLMRWRMRINTWGCPLTFTHVPRAHKHLCTHTYHHRYTHRQNTWIWNTNNSEGYKEWTSVLHRMTCSFIKKTMKKREKIMQVKREWEMKEFLSSRKGLTVKHTCFKVSCL